MASLPLGTTIPRTGDRLLGERIPWILLACICGLLGIGLFAIARGDDLYGGQFLMKQLVWGTLGGVVALLFAAIDYRVFRKWSGVLFLLSLAGLFLVFAMPAVNGSRRWIPLGPITLQPSEFTKTTYLLGMASYLMHQNHYRKFSGLLVPFLLTLVPVGLIVKEPDLGTSLLFIPTLYAMLYAAGARWQHLAGIALMGVMCIPLLWTQMSAEQKSRVTVLWEQVDGGETPRGDGFHLHQSKKMLVTSGWWGSALETKSTENTVHLPAARTDFIFCLIGERFGFPGCAAVVVLFVVMIGQGLQIASRTYDPFGRLIAVGIVTFWMTQFMINTNMTIGLAPITGLTLPWLSYGGSSLLSTCIMLGLLISVAIHPGYELRGEPFRYRQN